QELIVQFLFFSVVSSCVNGVHGRSIELFEQLDELRGALLGMCEVVRVRHHRDVLLGYSSLTKALENVTSHPPSHRADETFRRRRRECRTYFEQLRHECRIVGYPVAHYDPSARFRDPNHFFGDVEGLRSEHRSEYGRVKSNESALTPSRLQASPSWNFSRLRPASAARLFPASTRFLAISTRITLAPRRANGSAVVPSPQPRSNARSGGFKPRDSTTASPD